MPSMVVHLALAGLLAAGLLGDAFGRRSLAVVLAAVAFADMDVFVGFVLQGGHRSAFHSLLIPSFGALALYYDTRVAERSRLRARFGDTAPRVAGVALVAFVFAAVGLDLVTGGANVLYPVHDQFYRFNGRFVLSNQRGLVQTFVELGDAGVDAGGVGSTREVHISSGVDPSPGREPKNVERIFPVVQSGWQLLLLATSVVVVAARLREAEE